MPATRALLEGWTGPVQTPDGDCVALGRVETVDPPFNGEEVRLIRLADGYEHESDVRDVALDLSRAECRDRVARVLARTKWPHADHADTTAPRWFATYTRAGDWYLQAEVVRHATDGRRSGSCLDADWWPLGLDPHDDARLPDGSRLVDALALAAVAREVLRAGEGVTDAR